MKPALRVCTIAVVFFCVVGSATAQTEQWLRYHTGPNPRGYRWLELSQTPPEKVALPKLQPGALYGRWDNAMDASGGRWFCLERSRKTGAHDRLYFDANGNGRLDDDSPMNATRRDERMSWFDPVRVVFASDDGPVTYHLIARLYQFGGDRAQLLVGSGGWYEGQILLGGKKRQVQLFDQNVNGAFNDAGTNPTDCDMLVLGSPETTRYVGRYLEVDDLLYHLEIARDGAHLKLHPAKDVPLGTVRVPNAISEFTALGPNGHFVRRPSQGEFQLPSGEYRTHSWLIERPDRENVRWQLSAHGIGRRGEFTVTGSEPASLQIGEPIRAVTRATESRSEIAFDLRLTGSLGESVQILRDNQQARAPRLELASTAGGFRATHSFEYG
jgi:hypothetical protein